MININMRCIEIDCMDELIDEELAININMRCIEICSSPINYLVIPD